MNLTPASAFAIPERCPRHADGLHLFKLRRVLPDGDRQPFLIHADRCDFCHAIRPIRPLPDAPAAFVHQFNATL